MNYSDEIWKPIKSLNNGSDHKTYYANQYGHIKIINSKFRKENIFREFNINSRGYARITTYYAGKIKAFAVHRLVAEAWISNPDNLPEVNHKDQNKINNIVSNLEWCDRKYNNSYLDVRIRAGLSNRKTILQYNIDGEFIAKYLGLVECANQTGCAKSDVCKCCKGQVFQVKGNIFIYEENGLPLDYYLAGKRHWKVEQYKDGKLINTFDTIRQASIITGVDDSNICKVLNNQMNFAGGYSWKYKKPKTNK